MWNRIELRSHLGGITNRLWKISEKAESCSLEYSRKTPEYCESYGVSYGGDSQKSMQDFACVCMSTFGASSSFGDLLKVVHDFPKFNTVILVVDMIAYLPEPACPTLPTLSHVILTTSLEVGTIVICILQMEEEREAQRH